jgi:hypothetical protein
VAKKRAAVFHAFVMHERPVNVGVYQITHPPTQTSTLEKKYTCIRTGQEAHVHLPPHVPDAAVDVPIAVTGAEGVVVGAAPGREEEAVGALSI